MQLLAHLQTMQEVCQLEIISVISTHFLADAFFVNPKVYCLLSPTMSLGRN